MSQFDEERKKLGLPTSNGVGGNFFEEERRKLKEGRLLTFEEKKIGKEYESMTQRGQWLMDKGDTLRKNAVVFNPTQKEQKKVEPTDSGWDEFAKGFIRGTGNLIDTIVPFTDPVKKGFISDMNNYDWFSEGTRDYLNDAFKPAETTSQKVGDIINEIGGSILPIGAAYKVADKGLDALNGLSKLPNAMQKYNKQTPSPVQSELSQTLQRGAAAGGLWGAQNEINRVANGNEFDLGDSALRMSAEMGLGAGLDAIGPAYRAFKNSRTLDTSAIKDFTGQPSQNVLDQLAPNQTQSKNVLSNDIVSQLSGQAKRFNVESPNVVEPVSLPKAEIQAPKVDTPLETPRIEPPSMPKVEPTQQPLQRPQNIPVVEGERKHFSTVANSEKATPDFIDAVKRLDKQYAKSLSDKEAADFANGLINRDIEEAYQFVKNSVRRDKRHITVGHRLIDELQQRGQVERAVDMIELLAEEGTKAGQQLQGFTMYNKLSVEGNLVVAQRLLTRQNELAGVNGKKQVLDETTVKNITTSVQTMQKMTGLNDLGNNVQNIMEGWKKGNAPTDAELETVRSFWNDYKKFVGDLTPKKERTKVQPVKETRNRDKVVDFMTKQEELAKQRIRARMNRANSLPLDIITDIGIVGASKIAKGTVKFADFTEEIVKEFGEEVRPYMNQIWDKAAETFNLQSSKISARKHSEIEKITEKALKDKTISEAEMDKIRQFAKQISTLTGDTKVEAQMELQATLNLLERPTFGQQLATTQYASLLLNPLTMIRNIIGNEVGYRVDRMARLLAIPQDIVRSKVFGTERTIVFVKPPNWKALFGYEGYGKGIVVGGKAGWKGVNPFGLQTQYDIGSPAFSASKQQKETMNIAQKVLVSKINPLHHIEKILGASLKSFDAAGYLRAYNAELRHQATLKAVNEGLKGKALKEAAERYFREADDNAQRIADEYGKYATFQNDTKFSNLLTKVKQGMNTGSTYIVTGGLGPTKEFGLGNLVIPFAKTPANLILRAIEYSPAGFLRSASLAKDAIKYKSIDGAHELHLSLSRAIMGTFGFSMFGYVLADKGVITSAGHSDYEVASLERNAGKQPNSVNITAIQRFFSSGFDMDSLGIRENDTFVSYDWMQPVSVSLALGAGVNQSVKEQGELKPFEATKNAVNSAGKTIINMSVLSGLNDLLSSYGDKEPSEYLTGPAQGLPSMYTPTVFNQFRKLSDNTARNTYSPDYGEYAMNKAKNRVPGVNKELPPAYDTLGNQREMYQDGSNNVFNVFFNPSFVRKYKPSAEAKFVLDYINETGDKSVAPRFAPKKLDGIDLTGAQRSEMQRIMGEEVMEGLQRVVPKLEGERDFEKIKKALDKVLSNAGDKARKELRKELSE